MNFTLLAYFSDFYLQSHNAIKGTARPCYYYVLNNGMEIPLDVLQDIVSHYPVPTFGCINY